VRPRVVHLDLRGHDAEGALRRVHALLGDPAERDLTRLLVLDDTVEMTRHHRAFEELLTSRRLELMLCVMVGRPAAAEAAVTLPGNIGAGQGSGVLWVADTTGVDWRLAASAPATRRAREPHGDAGLRRLLDVLAYPEVFDRTCELAARVPGGVACPGLQLAGVGGGQEEFLFALAAAVERILDPDAAGPLPAADRIIELPLGAAGRPTLVPGAPLNLSYDYGRQAVEAAVEYAGRLQEPGALFGSRLPVEEFAAAAGQALQELRDRLADLFAAAHSTGELSPAQRAVIHEQGLRLAAPEGPDRGKIRESVAGYVSRGLEQETSLPRLAEALRSLERRLSPRGSQARIGELEVACPPDLLARLRRPPRFPPPGNRLAVAGLFAGALAALHGSFAGVASGLAMAALWTVLVAATIIQGPGGRLDRAAAGPLAVNGLAALAGVALGAGVGSTGPQPLVWGVGLALALLVAGVAVTASWRVRATRWRAESGVDGAAEALERLIALAFQVAAEWSQVAARLDTVDALMRAKASVDGVAGRLRTYAISLRADLERIASRTWSGDLPQFVQIHLVDLVTAALAPRWSQPGGDPVEHERLAARDTGDLIAAWEKHVEDHGPAEPPPFAAERELPPPTVATGDRFGISQTTLHDPHDVMWQLCTAADLPLLDPTARSLATLRFAPRSERPAIESRLPPDTMWIPAARHAGVLRLVPLRPGLVVHTWTGGAGPVTAGPHADPVDSYDS
jgi:hypothetical protein